MRTSTFILSILALGMYGSGQAQQVTTDQYPRANMVAISDSDHMISDDKPSTGSMNKGNDLFVETFSNGFDGENGAWTAEDNSPSGDQIWKIGGNGGPTPGNFSGGIGNLAPTTTTSSNGYAFFDAYGYNSPLNPAYETLRGTLTSPSLDFSGNASVILEYQQRFAYCCFGFSPLTVEVSIDGGTAWTTFPGEGNFIPQANSNSGNLTTLVDISCVAANESDVLVRFAYNDILFDSFFFYSWTIDDVRIYEAPGVNDLEIIQVTNGDVQNIWEYRVTPIQQAITAADGGLEVRAMYVNRGSADQTNASVTVDVLDNGGTSIFTYTSPSFDVLSNANALDCPNAADTLIMNTGFVPSAIGEYTLRAEISSDQTDDSPIDNVMEKSIVYTNHVYGHDDENDLTKEYRGTASTGNAFQTWGVGNFYTVPNEGSSANGILVRFGSNTDADAVVEARLYEVDPLVGIGLVEDAGDGDASTVYEIQAADIPSTNANSIETWLEFEDEFELLPGLSYFACVIVNNDVQTLEVTCLGTANSDTDNSTRAIALTSTQVYNWFGDASSPAVRLTMDGDPTALNEVDALQGVTLGQNMPNPAQDRTTIQVELDKTMDIGFQIIDATGKLVFMRNYYGMQPGVQNIVVDLKKFTSGMYQYSITSGNSRVTKSMMVTK